MDPNITDAGESRGPPMSRNFEKDRDAIACPVFGHLFRLTLRGDGLPFRRISNKRSVHSRHPGAERRHDYAPPGDVYLGYWRHYYQNDYIARPGHRHGWWRSDGHYRQLCFRSTVAEFPGRLDWCLSHDRHHG